MGSVGDVEDFGTVTAVGVDWITVTLPPGARGAVLMEAIGGNSIADAVSGGAVPKPAGRHGYQGIMADGAFWGEGDQGVMLTVSGKQAAKAWREVKEGGLAARCTRIDVRVDARVCGEAGSVISAAYGSYRSRVSFDKRLQARHCALYRGRRGGLTFSIGSPSSERRLRLYDKGAESGDRAFDQVARAEVQYRGAQAKAVYSRLMEVKDHNGACLALTASAFDRAGVDLPWFRGVAPEEVHAEYVSPSAERSLAWLRSQVRKKVADLIAAGHGAEVYEALGLPCR